MLALPIFHAVFFFFFSSRRRHTRSKRDWSSDVCSSDLPRIADRVGEGDFVGFMSNLNLPHPKLLEVAVPANLQVGRSEAIGPAAAAPRWAALRFTVAGIREIEPAAPAEISAPVQLVDVR